MNTKFAYSQMMLERRKNNGKITDGSVQALASIRKNRKAVMIMAKLVRLW